MRLAFAALLLVAAPAAAGKKTLKLDAGAGELRVTFDPAKVSEADVRAAAALCPRSNPDGLTIPGLEICRESAPDYKPCGSRKIDAPNFLANAEVNLRAGRKEAARIAATAVPKEMAPAVEFLKRSANFYLGLEEAKFRFYQAWKLEELEKPIEGIDPRASCGELLKKIGASPTPGEKYGIASFQWHNCMNAAYHKAAGEYPEQPWKDFVKAYGIKEKYIEQEGD